MIAEYCVALGPVLSNKIQPNDEYWKTLNHSFNNTMLAPDIIAAEVYDGKPFTTWCDPQLRKPENYHLGQHLGVDFDTEDKKSTIAFLLKEPFIGKYASFLYTTLSHTPDKPRARVVFLLDTPIYQYANYTTATKALLWFFGIKEQKYSNQLMFFYGGKPGGCEIEFLGNELPLIIIKDMIQRYKMLVRVC